MAFIAPSLFGTGAAGTAGAAATTAAAGTASSITFSQVAGLAIGLAGPVLQAASQNQAAKQQAEHQRRVMEAQAKQAALNRQIANQRQAQERESLAREEERAVLASRKAIGTARTQLAQSGATGVSTGELLQDFQNQQERFRQAIQRQKQFVDASAQLQTQADDAALNAQFTSFNQPVQGASLGAMLLGAGNAFVSFQRQLDSRSNRVKGILKSNKHE